MLEPFQLPFVQRALLEVLILAVPAGLLGTWIVLRGLAFFSHAVGTATFPGLVLAEGLGFAAPLGALGAAIAFALGVTALRGRRTGGDAAVALVLAGCLAAGVILAGDVFASGASVETLLFGSLLLVDGGDLGLAAAVAGATLVASALLGRHWLRAGFDPTLPAPQGPSPRLLDAILIGLIALAIVAALTVVGSLLVAALFLVPAITARLLTDRLWSWQLASVCLVAVEGALGLWLSVKTDAPPGATIACVAGAGFVLVALARLVPRPPRTAVATAALAAAALFAAGCGEGGEDKGDRLEVVATTTQVADLVREVGGERVDVTQLLQPDSDPHDYEPRPSDVEAVAGAELIFASGQGLDDWIDEAGSDAGAEAEVVELGSGVPVVRPGDPHWWHDPRNAEAAALAIERALISADAEHLTTYRRRATAYGERLRALDGRIASCMRRIPPARRRLVTDHDAIGYFADRYGLEVVGTVFPSQTTQAQPSAGDLSDLAASIETEGVRAVFPESALSADVATAIADQTGAAVGDPLYGDSLGPSGSDGATYLAMQEANADAIARGLGGVGCAT
jgi:ABC-type Zn uptake system ZnuABC Zn-binding protein ZnuA/ABC-type Mn2+/Zn2+ transport system permease subunit